MVPADGCHAVWLELLGTNRGRHFLMTAQTLTAQQLHDWGVVGEVQGRELDTAEFRPLPKQPAGASAAAPASTAAPAPVAQAAVPAPTEAKAADSKPALLESFCQWMREHRGSSELTLYNYGLPIRDLIRRFGEDPSKLDAQGLRKFVLNQSRSSGWATAKRCTTALRMFLRFLIAEGRCRAGLLGAIPVLAHWRLSSLPRYVSPEAVERVIDSCNVSSPVGKRDRAILLLLARLGLRAGDIVQMRLEDIDWKEPGCMSVERATARHGCP